MQLEILQHQNGEEQLTTAPSAFIEANTIPITLKEIREKHIIPVFAKDNEPAISQVDFVEVVEQAARQSFPNQRISLPQVRFRIPLREGYQRLVTNQPSS